MNHLTLLIHCPDQKGIIAAVTNFVQQQTGNIIYIDQHVDSSNKEFFMRLECASNEEDFSKDRFEVAFESSLAIKYQMNWKLFDADYTPNMAIFVSKYDHCLFDILARHLSGELGVNIKFILSNHKDLEFIATNFEVPFYHIPVTRDTKATAEKQQLALLKKHQVDFVVLARYMQIVSAKLINEFPNRIINIHHSFLPAFPGAKPYHSAFERGVKIIGATSHYVTEELDAGPIIEQDTTRVSHVHTIKDFIAKGRDLEKIVLSRAIKLHTERKTMVYNNKTIVFS